MKVLLWPRVGKFITDSIPEILGLYSSLPLYDIILILCFNVVPFSHIFPTLLEVLSRTLENVYVFPTVDVEAY